jgi:hypothetical protein
MEQFTTDLLTRFDFPEDTTLIHQTRIEETAGAPSIGLHHSFVMPSRSSASDELSELQFVGRISVGAMQCSVEGKAQGFLEDVMGGLQPGLHVFFEAQEEVGIAEALDKLELMVRAICGLHDIPIALGIRLR